MSARSFKWKIGTLNNQTRGVDKGEAKSLLSNSMRSKSRARHLKCSSWIIVRNIYIFRNFNRPVPCLETYRLITIGSTKTIILPVFYTGVKYGISYTTMRGRNLMVLENIMPRRIFWRYREELTRGWKELHIEDIRAIKSKGMRWAGHITRMHKFGMKIRKELTILAPYFYTGG